MRVVVIPDLSALDQEEQQLLRRGWGWFVALGVLIGVLGVVGLFLSGVLTLVSVLLIGWLLLVAGVLEVVHACWRNRWRGFGLDLFNGAVSILLGVLILTRPVAAAGVLTLLIAGLLVLGGVVRAVAAVAFRNPYGS